MSKRSEMPSRVGLKIIGQMPRQDPAYQSWTGGVPRSALDYAYKRREHLADDTLPAVARADVTCVADVNDCDDNSCLHDPPADLLPLGVTKRQGMKAATPDTSTSKSMPTAPRGKGSRVKVAVACQNCRRKKIKCDGGRPGKLGE